MDFIKKEDGKIYQVRTIENQTTSEFIAQNIEQLTKQIEYDQAELKKLQTSLEQVIALEK